MWMDRILRSFAVYWVSLGTDVEPELFYCSSLKLDLQGNGSEIRIVERSAFIHSLEFQNVPWNCWSMSTIFKKSKYAIKTNCNLKKCNKKSTEKCKLKINAGWSTKFLNRISQAKRSPKTDCRVMKLDRFLKLKGVQKLIVE